MKHHRKKAVALSYDQSQYEAPHLSAKGEGEIAEKIIRLAEENDIPIQEDASLVSLLAQLDLNETVPPDLYEAVAEIFAFIYRLDQHHTDK
ncbi:MAG TPA: EscU/YscU/HrcU family type III secretion system export apparatus switch protein [Bacillales bacterium]|nr:EscU/YscU/HrcU family type III secretion system export apparatus switch protein [Bacillales bacterium]